MTQPGQPGEPGRSGDPGRRADPGRPSDGGGPGGRGSQGFPRSVRCALAGVARLVARERNARLHALATAGVVVAGLALRVDRGAWALLALAMGGVWAAEALNTAVEELADVVSPGPHPAVGRAKDVAAGGVLLAAVAAVVVGALVFVPRLLELSGA